MGTVRKNEAVRIKVLEVALSNLLACLVPDEDQLPRDHEDQTYHVEGFCIDAIVEAEKVLGRRRGTER